MSNLNQQQQKQEKVNVKLDNKPPQNQNLIKKSFKVKIGDDKPIQFALNDEESKEILDEVHKFCESGRCDVLESKDMMGDDDAHTNTITLETQDVYTRRFQLLISKSKIDVHYDMAQSVVSEICQEFKPEELIPNWQYDCTIYDWAKICIGKGTNCYGEYLGYKDKSDWTYGHTVLVVYKDDATRKRPDFSKSKLLCTKCVNHDKEKQHDKDDKDDNNTSAEKVTTVTFISSSIYTFNLSVDEVIINFTSLVCSNDLPLATLVTNKKTYFLNHLVWIDNAKLSQEDQTSTIAIILNVEEYLKKRSPKLPLAAPVDLKSKKKDDDDDEDDVLFTMDFIQNIYSKFVSAHNKQKLWKKSRKIKCVQHHHLIKDLDAYQKFYKEKLSALQPLYPQLPRLVLIL